MGIAVGEVIDGKYRVTACIGEGGMGAVFAGEHLKLHRRVAIKTLHPSLAQDPEVVGRFEREAQAAGRIGNDHILEVFDIGELPGGDRYMVMEFLDGEAMNTRLSRLGRLSPAQVYPLAKQMLVGLGAAHAAGIVHRDLKPANIFIQREKAGVPDYVKIIDFGISKFRTLAGETHQTRTGTIIGTPAYMSPEQARGLREADARSDIYAIGVIIYEAVTGRVPFEGASTNDVLFKIFLNEVPVEALAQSVDPGFCSIVMKALAKEPEDRFARAEEFGAALDEWAQTGRGVTVSRSAQPAETILEAPRAQSASQAPSQPYAPMVSPHAQSAPYRNGPQHGAPHPSGPQGTGPGASVTPASAPHPSASHGSSPYGSASAAHPSGAGQSPARPTQEAWAESQSSVGTAPPRGRSGVAIAAAVGIAVSLIVAGVAVNALRHGHDGPPASGSVSGTGASATPTSPTVAPTAPPPVAKLPEPPAQTATPIAAAQAPDASAVAVPPASTGAAGAGNGNANGNAARPPGANRGHHPPPPATSNPPPARPTANPLDQL
jgi:serine/threonine protein kinase